MYKIFGKHDDNTLIQMGEVAAHAEYVALMADGHLGYSMPIGGVAAFDNKVSVTGVGFDIACGNCAMQTPMNISEHPDPIAFMADLGYWIQDNIAMGVGKANTSRWAPTGHPLFDSGAWDIVPAEFRSELKATARKQLGSCGSGNHYVDILTGQDGAIWVGNHFGSRGLGHKIATAFINIANGGKWGDRGGKEGMCLLDLDTQAGQDYWALMSLAGEYAYAGRDWVNRAVLQFMGTHPIFEVHNNHNFAWKEIHHDQELIVVRKGATPAFPGQRGFVGGSMGDDAVILEGAQNGDLELQNAALMSTVHGAGRVMSRTAATGRNRRGKFKAEPKVNAVETARWLKERGVLVFGAGLDEAPQAYRRLPDVLASQGATVTVLDVLSPRVVVMAPNDFNDAGKPTNPFLK